MIDHKVTRSRRRHRHLRTRRRGRASARLVTAVDQRARDGAAGGDGGGQLVTPHPLRPPVQQLQLEGADPAVGRRHAVHLSQRRSVRARRDGRAEGAVAARQVPAAGRRRRGRSPRRPASSSICRPTTPARTSGSPTARTAAASASSTASSTSISRATCSRRSTTPSGPTARAWPRRAGAKRCASPTTGSRRTCPTAAGRSATASPSPTAPPRRRYSMPTGSSRSAIAPAPRRLSPRLLAHPAVSRAVEEARPYRHYFPLGAPDRD